MVKPSFAQRTEIIPQAEVEAALAEADLMNAKLAETVELPPEIELSELNLQFKSFNVETVLPGDAPMNIRTIIRNRVAGARAFRSRLLNPAVRQVTD
mgnify:CR=1 FL=1